VGIQQLWISALLFAGVVGWIVLQNATWTPMAWHHPIWTMSAQALDAPIAGSISVDRELTTIGLIRLLTAAAVFWLAMQLCRETVTAQRFLAALGLLFAVYAALHLATLFAAERESTSFWPASAGFPAVDDYATFAGMGLIVVTGLLIKLYRNDLTSSGGSTPFRIASMIEATGQRGALLVGAAFLIGMTLVLSKSQSALVATGLGLLVLVTASLMRPRKPSAVRSATTKLAFAGLLLAGVIAAVVLQLALPDVGAINVEGVSHESRLAIGTLTWRSILASPWLGYGYGTFAEVFDMIRDRSISTHGLWASAHNSYLEVLQGLGVIVGSMLVVSFIPLLWTCFASAMTRSRFSILPAISLGTAVLVGLQAAVSSAMQTQVVALIFVAVLGAAVGQSYGSRMATHD
jgi:O-antigen ligase